jgi:hypothetical protein
MTLEPATASPLLFKNSRRFMMDVSPRLLDVTISGTSLS